MPEHECHLDAQLAYTCRLMLGAHASGYKDVPPNFDAQHLAHAKRIRRPLDFVHAPAKELPFGDRHVGVWARSRTSTYVIHDWHPALRWQEAGTSTARQRMRVAARRIAHLKRPVMLVVAPGPELGLAERGNRTMAAGTPQEYRRMWQIVRDVFAEEGARNVCWGMSYANGAKSAAPVGELWPGNDLVDWLWFNAYGSDTRPDLQDNIGRFLSVADEAGIGQRQRWGILEWGMRGTWRGEALDYFTGARDFLDTPAADRLSAWVVTDSPGARNESGLRLAFDHLGDPHPEKLDAYKSFAAHPKFGCLQVGCAGLLKNRHRVF